MITIAENRTLKMNDALSHPLGPCHWSLASVDGLLRTNKSSLAKGLARRI